MEALTQTDVSLNATIAPTIENRLDLGGLAAPLDRLATALQTGLTNAGLAAGAGAIAAAETTAKAAESSAAETRDFLGMRLDDLRAVATTALAVLALYFAVRGGRAPQVQI